ncbi:hypothetical protein E1286_37150 [Nonomuraea terrae]|uniref:Uncharacterized protein n=1 Tax=Nonomuraea terrae TaxID=2530383 RepID=A0A4R4Y1J1_9ACTN|nr:hypothetical protein [Nonomuraea terrae]TDD37500.1 hypothetical protein E1286_37150 [Nonomuraea terrae]
MLTVLGTIASLMIVAILVVLAVLLISAVTMAALLATAATLVRWHALWLRLTRRRSQRRSQGHSQRLSQGEPRLPLKLSGDTVPDRLRADLSGNVPLVRRRLTLGGARPAGRGSGHGRSGAGSHRSRLHLPVTAERRTRTEA